jgi:hypothetical protein
MYIKKVVLGDDSTFKREKNLETESLIQIDLISSINLIILL